MHGDALRSDGLHICSAGLPGGNPRSGGLHGGAIRSAVLHGGNLRSGALHGGALRSDGLPLLQPLPLRWSGRPRGLRIVTITCIAARKVDALQTQAACTRRPNAFHAALLVARSVDVLQSRAAGANWPRPSITKRNVDEL